MKKTFICLLICVALWSCSDEEHVTGTFEEDVIELNWTYAVKDLYLLDCAESSAGNVSVMVPTEVRK